MITLHIIFITILHVASHVHQDPSFRSVLAQDEYLATAPPCHVEPILPYRLTNRPLHILPILRTLASDGLPPQRNRTMLEQ
jgi:hypothetical protein